MYSLIEFKESLKDNTFPTKLVVNSNTFVGSETSQTLTPLAFSISNFPISSD